MVALKVAPVDVMLDTALVTTVGEAPAGVVKLKIDPSWVPPTPLFPIILK